MTGSLSPVNFTFVGVKSAGLRSAQNGNSFDFLINVKLCFIYTLIIASSPLYMSLKLLVDHREEQLQTLAFITNKKAETTRNVQHLFNTQNWLYLALLEILGVFLTFTTGVWQRVLNSRSAYCCREHYKWNSKDAGQKTKWKLKTHIISCLWAADKKKNRNTIASVFQPSTRWQWG